MQTDEYNISEIKAALASDSPEKQVSALKASCRICTDLASSAVDALKASKDPYFLFEYLPRFGSIVARPLEDILLADDNDEVKVLASLVLLKIGSRKGDAFLLQAVATEPAQRYACMIINALAETTTVEAKAVLSERLSQYANNHAYLGQSFESNADKDCVVCLIEALKVLKADLPANVAPYLTAPDMPLEVASAIAEYHQSKFR